jgi:signal transduction histidine kinase
MSPTATLRLRRTTAAIAVLWALLALVLSVLGQISAPDAPLPPLSTTSIGGIVIVEWRSDEAIALGVERGDRVLTVDGEAINQWYRRRGWEDVREGIPVRYELRRANDEAYQVAAMPQRRSGGYQGFFVPLYAASLAVGICYLALGGLVWRGKPDRAESWAFLLFCSAMAMQLWSAFETFSAPWGYERMLMNLPFVGAAGIHLFTTFPSEPPWVVRHTWIRSVPYVAAFAIALAVVFEPALGLPPKAIPTLSFAGCISMVGIALAVLAHERFQRRLTDDTQRADVVLLGTLFSFVPVVVVILGNLLFRWGFPTSVALLWWVIFPFAVAYGIVRNQLFDIRGAARSSAAYGAATLAITGLFATLITFADALFSRFNVNANSPWFQVTFLFFAILAFNPLRNRLQDVVDRFFDRDRANYRTAVREISEAMVSMLSLDEISDRLLIAVTDTMGVERSMVMLIDDEERQLRPAAWRGDWDEEVLASALPIDHPIGKHLWMRRQELARRDFDEATDAETRETCRDVFDSLEVELLVPILFGVDLLGVIAVGRKLSGESPGADDRQLLRTLANQSAIAIENARAFDEIAKLNETLEARVEERTRELRETQTQLMQSEKMRSLGQLVAGVAHELNNPIGFVHANLQLLDGYVSKLVAATDGSEHVSRPREAIAKLLSRSREGTERVKKIVQDLRTFSRVDEAELTDADLNEEIERTLALMEARFKEGITVERDFGAIPKVRCFAGQLNQVFMNLLMNSCDALEGRGSIVVRTAPHGDGVCLEFSDDGPGIPEELRERIFEPFFTTKPVGQGTGLGLSISHGIVERHGGRMEVNCPEEGGTHFRIELPRVATPREQAA